MKNPRKKFALALIIAALFILVFTLSRALYYTSDPSNKDTGLAAGVITSTVNGSAVADRSNGKLPTELLIPSLGIRANVQHVGVTEKGNMAAPSNLTDVGWYKHGAVPGEEGSAVLAGHVSNALTVDGVFKHLEDLVIGDRVYVTDEGGNKLEFKVVEKRVYPYNKSPLEYIFNRGDKARLNLITCSGEWRSDIRTSDHRLVVYTELVYGIWPFDL